MSDIVKILAKATELGTPMKSTELDLSDAKTTVEAAEIWWDKYFSRKLVVADKDELFGLSADQLPFALKAKIKRFSTILVREMDDD